jgi:hypothetical protein
MPGFVECLFDVAPEFLGQEFFHRLVTRSVKAPSVYLPCRNRDARGLHSPKDVKYVNWLEPSRFIPIMPLPMRRSPTPI